MQPLQCPAQCPHCFVGSPHARKWAKCNHIVPKHALFQHNCTKPDLGLTWMCPQKMHFGAPQMQGDGPNATIVCAQRCYFWAPLHQGDFGANLNVPSQIALLGFPSAREWAKCNNSVPPKGGILEQNCTKLILGLT